MLQSARYTTSVLKISHKYYSVAINDTVTTHDYITSRLAGYTRQETDGRGLWARATIRQLSVQY
jgi:hypothetical protein